MIAKFNVQFQLLARPRSKSKNLFLNISSSFSKYSTKFFSLSLFIFFFFWRSRDRVEIARYFFLEKTSHRLSFDLEKQIFSLIFFFFFSRALSRAAIQSKANSLFQHVEEDFCFNFFFLFWGFEIAIKISPLHTVLYSKTRFSPEKKTRSKAEACFDHESI